MLEIRVHLVSMVWLKYMSWYVHLNKCVHMQLRMGVQCWCQCASIEHLISIT